MKKKSYIVWLEKNMILPLPTYMRMYIKTDNKNEIGFKERERERESECVMYKSIEYRKVRNEKSI